MKLFLLHTALFGVLLTNSCGTTSKSVVKQEAAQEKPQNNANLIVPGADQLQAYLPLFKGKKVGIMGNQTSVVGEQNICWTFCCVKKLI